MSLPIQNLNQGDPRFGDIVMAPSKLKIRNFGCLATAILDTFPVYQIQMDPVTYFNKLVSVGGFDPEGNLNHTAIEKIDPNLVFYERVYTTNSKSQSQKMLVSAAIDRARSLLSLGQPVMLEVDNVGNDGRGDHWLCASDFKAGDKPDFLVSNPDGGKMHWFSERYGDPQKGLHGLYCILGPSQFFPDGTSRDRQQMGLAAWKAAMVWSGKSVPTYSKEILSALLG